ncbi:sensor histidine kinase [Clostridium sp. 'White wine YQ']|uniref:sensor histidine kinase n=1 Tax=Clostridium sp. 'White wine YQ' TaxID=3027474 RepID=UPI0023667E23|nr:PAS domain-containing sensor histidine kinase [Clostridium sp. 'White wine YQ']MDD7795702.1 PAS domain-containing sensor histidine kinase [Clostridium sp. 'White wine YQ']
MGNKYSEKSIKIEDILLIVKTLALFASATVIFTKFSIKVDALRDKSSFIPVMIIIASIFIIVYIMWLIMNFKSNNKLILMIVRYLEGTVFLSIFTSILIISNDNVFQYKLLFLFIIITTTIQSGMIPGIEMASVASFIILGIDLKYGSHLVINTYLENDLIIITTFIVTALVLGYYVKTEKEKLAIRDDQLLSLSQEIKEYNSKRKYIEELLINNDFCYNNLIENSKNIIFIHRNFNLIFANRSAMELFGIDSYEELQGKSFLDLFHESDTIKIKKGIKSLMERKTNEIRFKGIILSKANGEKLKVDGSSTYFFYDGRPTVLSIYRDITYKEKAESLQKAVKENERLLQESKELNNTMIEIFSNISHEFKTPLNVISSASQVLSLYERKGDPIIVKKQQYLESIKQNCYRLTRLVNNLLELTKVDKGAIKLNLHNHNIVVIVEEIISSIVAYVENRGLSIIFDTDIEEKYVSCDVEKIEAILLNLLSNAIKFSKSGDTIFVQVTDNDEYVDISVKDTGLGIPSEKMDLIFERFGQVDKTFRRNNEGTGIGLSLVKSYVEMHHGSIEVKSELNVGSEFIIKLIATNDNSIGETFTYEPSIDIINMEFSDIQ